MLTFGGGSSAGIYDDAAKLVKDLAAVLSSKNDKRMVNQVLEDVVACGCGPQGDGSVNKFYDAYISFSTRLRVSLASESDVDKAFCASHEGKVLGINYDLKRWVWRLSDDQLIPMLWMFKEVEESDTVENSLVISFNGKLNHYMWLVSGGPWQRGFLLRLQNELKPSGFKVKVSVLAKEQASWGLLNLRVSQQDSKLPDPREMSCMNPVRVFSDAAGGDAGKIKNGIGGFTPPY